MKPKPFRPGHTRASARREKRLQDAIAGIVLAWDSLPGGRSYTPATVEQWLIREMAPAVTRAREVL